jgi:hypothetical protein
MRTEVDCWLIDVVDPGATVGLLGVDATSLAADVKVFSTEARFPHFGAGRPTSSQAFHPRLFGRRSTRIQAPYVVLERSRCDANTGIGAHEGVQRY